MTDTSQPAKLLTAILEKLTIANYTVDPTYSSEQKKLAKYDIGVLCNEARATFDEGTDGDTKFGAWIASGIKKEFPKVDSKTFYNYRQLPNFCSKMKVCELVGFTNVYELMKEGKQDQKKLVQEFVLLLAPTGEASDEDKIKIKAKVKAVLYPPTYQAEEIIENTAKFTELLSKPSALSREELLEMLKVLHDVRSDKQMPVAKAIAERTERDEAEAKEKKKVTDKARARADKKKAEKE
ncbi:hypothetical protein [Psychromonas sp. Urea-02u-13]|uniref:hypothetical protein n=1 Tax=Psychromonas sp. Urea-02u-13 TaxID=2058326 RepID=UPI000C322753|nr:hypothetical protein [Psychromonas sp. Urea-02u-13]PKG37708.1 hypothetical protein CXF74_17385 [Psychromonas sp. Urea-02u-13]